jgi:hypothetical protein
MSKFTRIRIKIWFSLNRLLFKEFVSS